MDPEQFKQLLDQQMLMFQQIFQELKTQSSSADSNTTPSENNDSKAEKFQSYIERLENYLAMKNMKKDKRKAQMLCSSIGSIHYNNLAAFLGPAETIKYIEYNRLVEAFSDRLSPKKNVVVSQHYFFSTYQSDTQAIPKYIASLQHRLADCDFYVEFNCGGCEECVIQFVSVAPIFLRVQFIRGIRDDSIREQLLHSNDVDFEETVKKAARIQCKESSRPDTSLITSEVRKT